MCAKALARGADEKSGCYKDWKSYINDQKEKPLFFPFRGNRFNVVFVLGKIVFYHHKRITTFLSEVHGTTNKLLEAILTDIQDPICLAGCRVFGLLSSLVTSPFWRIVEQCKHVLDLNSEYEQLHQFLKDASLDATSLLTGTSPFSREFGLVYWGLTPQQQPGSYQGGEMMIKSVFWWRKPEYPEETTDLRQVTDETSLTGTRFLSTC